MALLTNAEREWLLGQKAASPGYARFLRHSIRKKLTQFRDSELPLILNANFDVGASVSADSNALVAQPGRAETLGNSPGYMREEEPWVGIPAFLDAFGPTTSTLPR